jgi:diacylglycerol kinase (ATP)
MVANDANQGCQATGGRGRPARGAAPLRWSGDRSLALGVVSNPASGRNRRQPGEVREFLAGRRQVYYVEAGSPQEMVDALESLARDGVEVLAVDGGDGTAQMALTALFRRSPFETPPLLALLPSGTTNMTARDVGVAASPGRALERVVAWASGDRRASDVITRSVVRVDGALGQESLYGMFFGAGAIQEGVEYFNERVRGLGVDGNLGAAVAFFRGLGSLFLGRGGMAHSVRVGVRINSGPEREQDWLLVLVSTLERLVLGFRPYFGAGGGPLHFTSVGARPRHLWRVLPFLVRGRRCRGGVAENGYFSSDVSQVALAMDVGFVLDGEVYRADPRRGPLIVRDGGESQFLRLSR